MIDIDDVSKPGTKFNGPTPLCNVACDPNCIFKHSVVKIQKEIKFMTYFYFIVGPLAAWKLIELIVWSFKQL